MEIEKFTKRTSWHEYAINNSKICGMSYINYSNNTTIQSARSLDCYRAMINYKKESNVFDLANVGSSLNTFTNLFANNPPLIYTYDNAKHKGSDTFNFEFQVKGNKYITFSFDKSKTIKIDKKNNNCIVYNDINHISEEYQLTKNGYYNRNYDEGYFEFFNLNNDKQIIHYDNYYIPDNVICTNIDILSVLPQTIEYYKKYNIKTGKIIKIYYDEYGIINEIPGIKMRYEKITNEITGKVEKIMSFHPMYYDLFDFNHIQGTDIYWAIDELNFNNFPTILFIRNLYKVTNSAKMKEYLDSLSSINYPILESDNSII